MNLQPMSMSKYLFSSCLFLALISCNNESGKSADTTMDSGAPTEPVPGAPNRACYAYTGKDTLQMRLFYEGERVWGNLYIHRQGKDYNNGMIDGKLVGDTLYGEYRFVGEGIPSSRPVVFLKKGEGFVEGYGELVTENGKTSFKGPVQFLDNNVLQRTQCE